MPENEFWSNLYFFLIVIAAAVLIALLVEAVRFSIGFAQELRYINNEIARTQGEERQYWQNKKRKLWLSLIPFVKY